MRGRQPEQCQYRERWRRLDRNLTEQWNPDRIGHDFSHLVLHLHLDLDRQPGHRWSRRRAAGDLHRADRGGRHLQPTTVIGTGDTSQCTEDKLSAAAANGGTITFNCGQGAVIPITKQIELPKDKATTIDGGGQVTLDGQGKTRIFHFDGGDFRKTMTVVTLQHLTIQNAKSSGTAIPKAAPPCSQGTDTDGGGAGILVRDGVLHVIDVDFIGNNGPALGPDVAGGGVYGIGAIDVTIVGSRFKNNSASNGGAVGSLFSNLTLVNNVFEGNQAVGTGGNTIDSKNCSAMGGEVGNGGNGGAVVIDGGESFDVTVCGDTFSQNKAVELAGGIFRTPDLDVGPTHINLSTFDQNTAKGGGAAYFHHSTLTITASTFSNNTAVGAGAIQSDDTDLEITNSTFSGNSATAGLGGAISLFGNSGKIVNSTFADNHSDGGSGLFAAALAGGSPFQIDNSIFANNTSKDCGAPMTCQVSDKGSGDADVQWPVNHLVCNGPDPACAPGTTFADPMLGTLMDNGGATQTIAPSASSPAASASTKNCPTTDQRGKTRPGTGCTAGAYQLP